MFKGMFVKKYYVMIVQVIIIALCFPIFALFGKSADPLYSFVFSFLAYWILIAVGTLLIVLFDEAVAKRLKGYVISANKRILLLINFIPAVAVFCIVFIPNTADINLKLFSAVAVIALFNGTFEELFWRGIALSKYSSSTMSLLLSTMLFTVFHFAFLLLPLHYHGGVINLVGGAAFMGVIWMSVSKITKNISFSIGAHILVNCFAFTGLFIDNKLM